MEEQQEWKVAAVSRQRQEIDGEALDYPGRLALCPRGHARLIPTRFSRVEFELHCPQCRRTYRFKEKKAAP
jgi:hypothetical protein